MSPTAVNWMLFLHILAALWLAAGVFASTVVRAQARRAATLAERVVVLRIGARLAKVFSLPGGLIAGLLGFGLLHPLGWGFRPGWVKVSIALWLLMVLNGILYLRPSLERLLAATEASAAAGAPTAELTRLAASKGPHIAADLNALGLVLLTLLMVVRPF
ncbi:MAG: DUF2269 family protein [Thermoanaerobaculia bacterium]